MTDNNILVNGDFEETNAGAATEGELFGDFFTAAAIAGWTATEGRLEVQDVPNDDNSIPVDPSGILADGRALELDSSENRIPFENGRDEADTTVEQAFTVGEGEGGSYQFEFSYTAQSSVATSEFSVEIVDGSGDTVLFQTFTEVGDNLELAWQRFSQELDLDAGNYRLIFSSVDFADSDRVGAVIDNVSLFNADPDAVDDNYVLDLATGDMLSVAPETGVLLDEDFSGEDGPVDLASVAESDMIIEDNAIFSNRDSDGQLLFKTVDVAAFDNSTLTFSISSDGEGDSNFERGDDNGDFVLVEISVDDGDFILLDKFEIRQEDADKPRNEQTFVGSKTGQTFDVNTTSLSYDLDPSAGNVQLRFTTQLSSTREIIRIDDVKITGDSDPGLLGNDTDGNGQALEVISVKGFAFFTLGSEPVTVLDEDAATTVAQNDDGELLFGPLDIAGLSDEALSFTLKADAGMGDTFESFGSARDFVTVEVSFNGGDSFQTLDVFDVQNDGFGGQVFVGSMTGQQVAVNSGFATALNYDLAALAGNASTAVVRLSADVTGSFESFEIDDVSLTGTQPILNGPLAQDFAIGNETVTVLDEDAAISVTQDNDGELVFEQVDIAGLFNENLSFTLRADVLLNDTFESAGIARDFVEVQVSFDGGVSFQTLDVFDVEDDGSRRSGLCRKHDGPTGCG